jgi:Flp pilus assembly protein TadD
VATGTAAILATAVDCALAVSDEHARAARELFREGQRALIEARVADAVPPLTRAVELDPLNALAHYGLGEANMGLARYGEAVAAFSRSREAFRCSASAAGEARKRAESRLRVEISELRDGIRALDERRLKENLVLWKEVNDDTRSAGQKLRALEDLRGRLEALEGALRSGNAVPAGVNLAIGTAHFQAGQLADAEREFRGMLAADPRSGDAHNNLAVICMLDGRLDEAAREIRLAEKAGIDVSPRLKQELRRRRDAQAAKKP